MTVASSVADGQPAGQVDPGDPAGPRGPAPRAVRPGDRDGGAPVAQVGSQARAAGAGHGSIDLLGPVVAVVRPLSDGMTVAQYTDFGTGLALNLPAQHVVRLAAGPCDALQVECDLPPWLSFETWLPDDATSREVGLAVMAERDVAAETFLRAMVDDVPQGDGPVARLTLGQGRPAAAGLSPLATTARSARQRVILLVRHPPAAFTIRQLRLNLTLASNKSAR